MVRRSSSTSRGATYWFLCVFVIIVLSGHALVFRTNTIFGSKIKMPKRCEKRFYEHIGVVVNKNPLQKHLIFHIMRAF